MAILSYFNAHDELDIKVGTREILSTITNLNISEIKRSNLMVFAWVINNYIYTYIHTVYKMVLQREQILCYLLYNNIHIIGYFSLKAIY